jgi:hypothetical protein
MFQWELKQMGAWAQMLRDYAQDSTLKQAVLDTFSGEKPCEMCKKLTNSKLSISTSGCEFIPPTPPPHELALPEFFRLDPPACAKFDSTIPYLISDQRLIDQPAAPPPRFFFC